MGVSIGESYLLKRERINELLEGICRLPLLVVVGAMGYGKTTAVQEFLKGKSGFTSIWFSFNEYDTNDDLVWRRFCDSLQGSHYNLYLSLRDTSFPKNRLEAFFIIEKIRNEIRENTVVVFDDFQDYEGHSFTKLIESIIKADIKGLHTVIISRTQPRLPYEEMRLKGSCAILEQSQLVLTESELEELFYKNDLCPKREEIRRIHEYTEGWMAASYLALLDYKENGRMDNLGSIFHLVRTSVFDRLDMKSREIIMKMSLFTSFTGEQAAFVTEHKECPLILRKVMDENKFIKHDILNGQYKIHSLLKSVALMELDHSGINRKMLYNRNGKWKEDNNQLVMALQNYFAAGNHAGIFKMLERHNNFLLYEQATHIIYNAFIAVDPEEKLNYFKAYFPFLYYYTIYVDKEEGRRLFEELQGCCNKKRIKENHILGELKIIEVFLKFNDIIQMKDCAREALELLEDSPSAFFNENMLLTFGVPEVLFLYHNRVGSFKEIVAAGKEYGHLYCKLSNQQEAGWEWLLESEYRFMTGDFEGAWAMASKAYQKAKFLERPCIMISSALILLHLCLILGKKEELHQKKKQLSKDMEGQSADMRRMVNSTVLFDYELTINYIYGLNGQEEKMSSWLKEFDFSNCNVLIRSIRNGCITYGLLLLNQKKYVELEALSETMSEPYKNTVHIFVLIFAKIYGAIAACHLYGEDKALNLLTEAILLASPDGIITPFIDHAKELMPLYEILAKTNPFIRRLLPLCRKYLERRGEEKGLAVKLTRREKEIMELVAAGYQNKEISQKLNIALVTVEKGLTGIYQKMGVKNRIMAIRCLRENKKVTE